ncbi:unnamed protein product [Phyllotreta striolata]|uniref:Protein-serine O-palmitoleoyltransferase porcupine n=1 Tax=Phyllotreta striolata TaxID=444603 RepID=A0A9N9TK55_PHYSR|nr:unnamed protein product [Phyllotreta striolata]
MHSSEWFETDESLLFYDDNIILEETSQGVWEDCVAPSIFSVAYFLSQLVLVNFIFALFVSTVRLKKELFHLLSGVCGLYLIYQLEFYEGKLLLILVFSSSYLVLILIDLLQKALSLLGKEKIHRTSYFSSSNIIKYTLIVILVLCEYFLMNAATWLEIRGLVMVFSMKLISLVDDMEKDIVQFPSFFNYFGYIFCGANVIFGPWISFDEYNLMYDKPTRKNFRWMFSIVRTLAISLFFLTVSNCFCNYVIDGEMPVFLQSYKEALSFRTSHYFVSFLSEVTMLSAGYKNSKIWNEPDKWRYEIVNPLKIEYPTALATVVTHWNKPMHDFLKKYVYRSWLPLGKFYAILATFVMSSFLHGFELKVSVVLITIGIFSYLQFALREYFAGAFDCCMRVHPCKGCCKHKHKREALLSICFRLLFTLTNVIHLVYLGMLMDSSTDEIGIINKWRSLYFISFWLMSINVSIILQI